MKTTNKIMEVIFSHQESHGLLHPATGTSTPSIYIKIIILTVQCPYLVIKTSPPSSLFGNV